MSASLTPTNDTVSATEAKGFGATTQVQDSAFAFTTTVTKANDAELTIHEEPTIIPTEFPKFNELPPELRVKIWMHTMDDIIPRVVEVYSYKEARVTPSFPAIFHSTHESREEAFKLAKQRGHTMTLNAEEKYGQPVERTFYFNYKLDTLLTTSRFAPDFYGSLAPEFADDDFGFLYRLTETYRHRAINDLFQAKEIEKVQKLAWHPIESDRIIEPNGFSRFKGLKDLIYVPSIERFTPSEGQQRYIEYRVLELTLMFFRLNEEVRSFHSLNDNVQNPTGDIPGLILVKVRAVCSAEDLVEEVEEGESPEKEEVEAEKS